MINIQTRKRKSVKLSKEEHKSLLRYVKSFDTIVEAAEEIGIHRNVLDMVMIRSTGSPDTIDAIRRKIAA